jgi:hypothetical protein
VEVKKDVSKVTTWPTSYGIKMVTGNVMSDKKISGGTSTLTVYDLTGKMVTKKDAGVSEGVYIVNLNRTPSHNY